MRFVAPLGDGGISLKIVTTMQHVLAYTLSMHVVWCVSSLSISEHQEDLLVA